MSENTATATVMKPSICPLDCPDTCSLSVEVTESQVVSVKGSDANPYTAGVICQKVAKYYPDYIHGEHRLTYPMKRVGKRGVDDAENQFERISWAEALDTIYEGFNQAIENHGPESVMPLNYAGPHGQISGGSMDYRFFHKLGATLLDRGPFCGAVRGTAYTSLFGSAPGMPPEQAAEADVVAVWGNNVTVSNLHLARVIKSARDKGAKLVVIDPKRTRIAEQAHLYLQIKPGTDVVLAMALACELETRGAFDEAFIGTWVQGRELFMQQARQYPVADMLTICGISADQFNQLATLYAQANNLALSIGNGIERGRSGGSGLRAIMSLNALTGQLGRPGAGIFAKPGLAFALTGDALQRPDLIPEGTRTFNIVDVGKLLLDDQLEPPIKAVFIYNHNPVCTHPDQNRMRRALRRDDLFVVGCDVVMTDSMRYADIILPAASHFEFDDIYAAYGQSYLQRAEPVIPTVGESLPNTEIFRRLAARFGFDDPLFKETDHELMDAAVDATDPRLNGHRPSQLPTDSALLMNTVDDEPVVMCKTVKPATASGKIELFSLALEEKFGFGIPRYDPVSSDFPLTLISPSSSKRTNTTFGSDPASASPELIEIHPEDAKLRGIVDGLALRIWNDLGEVTLIATITDTVPPGVVYSAKGTWLATSSTGQTVNALIPADLKTDIMQGACYNETFVDCEVLD